MVSELLFRKPLVDVVIYSQWERCRMACLKFKCLQINLLLLFMSRNKFMKP